MTVILITHEPDIAAFCSRQVTLRDGVVVGDELNPNLVRASERLAESAEVAA
jgi:putative ABC transport system ATP-binding protein